MGRDGVGEIQVSKEGGAKTKYTPNQPKNPNLPSPDQGRSIIKIQISSVHLPIQNHFFLFPLSLCPLLSLSFPLYST